MLLPEVKTFDIFIWNSSALKLKIWLVNALNDIWLLLAKIIPKQTLKATSENLIEGMRRKENEDAIA